jgi:outer membrane murein-binding lipoprotein Lpp
MASISKDSTPKSAIVGISLIVAILLFIAFCTTVLAGCSRGAGSIQASAISGTVQDVTSLHDALIRGEVTVDSLTQSQKDNALLASESLTKTVNKALEGTEAP